MHIVVNKGYYYAYMPIHCAA